MWKSENGERQLGKSVDRNYSRRNGFQVIVLQTHSKQEAKIDGAGTRTKPKMKRGLVGRMKVEN